MTGKAILEALSFVDEAYIDESESCKIRKRKHTAAKVLLPLAACLGLILWGIGYAGSRPVNETMKDQQIRQEPAMDTEQEIIVENKDHSATSESDIAMYAAQMPCVSEVPAVILTIQEWTGEGFTAVVAGTVDAECFAVGTVLNVAMQPNMCIETIQGELVSVERRIPTEADFPAGSRVRVRFSVYTEEDNTLHIESICKEE